jgi:hypothetical protein
MFAKKQRTERWLIEPLGYGAQVLDCFIEGNYDSGSKSLAVCSSHLGSWWHSNIRLTNNNLFSSKHGSRFLFAAMRDWEALDLFWLWCLLTDESQTCLQHELRSKDRILSIKVESGEQKFILVEWRVKQWQFSWRPTSARDFPWKPTSGGIKAMPECLKSSLKVPQELEEFKLNFIV